MGFFDSSFKRLKCWVGVDSDVVESLFVVFVDDEMVVVLIIDFMIMSDNSSVVFVLIQLQGGCLFWFLFGGCLWFFGVGQCQWFGLWQVVGGGG